MTPTNQRHKTSGLRTEWSNVNFVGKVYDLSSFGGQGTEIRAIVRGRRRSIDRPSVASNLGTVVLLAVVLSIGMLVPLTDKRICVSAQLCS